jgi:hypothetical protein
MNKFRDERWNVTTIQRLIRDYFENLHFNKIKNPK